MNNMGKLDIFESQDRDVCLHYTFPNGYTLSMQSGKGVSSDETTVETAIMHGKSFIAVTPCVDADELKVMFEAISSIEEVSYKSSKELNSAFDDFDSWFEN